MCMVERNEEETPQRRIRSTSLERAAMIASSPPTQRRILFSGIGNDGRPRCMEGVVPGSSPNRESLLSKQRSLSQNSIEFSGGIKVHPTLCQWRHNNVIGNDSEITSEGWAFWVTPSYGFLWG
jgi:hypothetical protein